MHHDPTAVNSAARQFRPARCHRQRRPATEPARARASASSTHAAWATTEASRKRLKGPEAFLEKTPPCGKGSKPFPTTVATRRRWSSIPARHRTHARQLLKRPESKLNSSSPSSRTLARVLHQNGSLRHPLRAHGCATTSKSVETEINPRLLDQQHKAIERLKKRASARSPLGSTTPPSAALPRNAEKLTRVRPRTLAQAAASRASRLPGGAGERVH